jgi:division protein CdvB (Snf7/Vps24/ESCRT-III family)
MLSKDLAKSIKHILDEQSVSEFGKILDALIEQEHAKLSYAAPQVEIIASLARVAAYRKLKDYRAMLEDSLRNG